ncbi:DNA-binding transcriptional response regulator, NtrC family, contains REC, AAA-type ATPase, and a Fis-type DNA-binding domains [Desulfacinum hydrothermale DSM 13146]|uniref:DNA-binding transcriptional response regulator, NtrC family, contains REC, AAA-type ATPase, and a Fis-type DNA-binding domains n=1 Tax=Desulfacinum hydrothermale DSM 13146 TaxID=1121390 RepID=A0A1W1X5M0_9BACT|nr:sigma-54 dependent transcriptional regulator [Desulfacinum hydrothermale]SMC19216.1 DNA-binding transcriptional response regulator, NtrC family, contains REC, AAA-type ATPase, and a Fis-type DNA-binding domains [Desulfacinum hydrothermale DSM 13146]
MRILLIDPDPKEAQVLQHILEELGHPCATASSYDEAWDLVQRFQPAAALAALDGDRAPVVHFLRKAQDQEDPLAVIVFTRSPKLEDAVEMMKHGAQDFWVQPISRDRLEKAIGWLEGRDKDSVPVESTSAPAKVIITRNPAMIRLKAMAAKVAASKATVFIQGESGTGKELFAHYLHTRSRRASAPFLAVNCAALPENLLESELFGYEKGAFTGANRLRKGKFELADKGTLLLDEVTEIPLHLQAKLLRVLQEGEVDRLGGRLPIPVDVRVIATTNVNVVEAVRDNRFRKDLYYRLNVIPLKIPPLRERKDDLPLLVDYFLKRFEAIHGTRTRRISREALSKMEAYPWPGNVRELENVVQRAVLLHDEETLRPEHLDFDPVEDLTPSQDLPLMSIGEMERHLIHKALETTEGNRTRAAEILGISVRTLRNKLNDYKQLATPPTV